MKQPVVLRIYLGDQLQGVKQFTDSQIVIGRQGQSVSLNDQAVAPIHAAIEERDTGYFVCDLGSETGTRRNGESVLDGRLDSGDVIEVGPFRIEFFVGVPKPKSAPGAAVATSSTQPPPIVGSPSPSSTTNDIPEEQKRLPPPLQTVPAMPPAQPSVATVTQIGDLQLETRPAPAPSSLKPSIDAKAQADARVQSRPRNFVHPKKIKTHRTFAPQGPYSSAKEYVKPSKGTVVNVVVMWQERVLSTYDFANPGMITCGVAESADVHVPVKIGSSNKVPLVKIDGRAILFIRPDQNGEMIKQGQSVAFSELTRQNRLIREKDSLNLVLEQGELVRIDVTDAVSIIVRYVPATPKPLIGPFLDLTTTESAGILMSFVLVGLLWVYTHFYLPPNPLDELNKPQEPLRMALIVVKPPPQPTPAPTPPAPEPTPVPTPPPVVKATPQPKKAEEMKVAQKKAETKADNGKAGASGTPGAAANLARREGPKKAGGVKSGGSIKTSDTEGSQAQTPKKELKNSGMFSVFGAGAQKTIDKEYSGSGQLAGLANASTGKSGNAENRPGDGLGTPLKDVGSGGTGVATMGTPGGTGKSLRASGNSGYGDGGLGDKSGVRIVPGGSEESFSGTIDKEAVRRVILANLRAIRACYEKELNRRPDLFGKVTIEWDIGERGRVMRGHVKSSELGSSGVPDCVLNRLKSWTFPEPPPGMEVTVSYPFFFSN